MKSVVITVTWFRGISFYVATLIHIIILLSVCHKLPRTTKTRKLDVDALIIKGGTHSKFDICALKSSMPVVYYN